MPCKRSSSDPLWCREHRSDFGDGAQVCLGVLLDRAARHQRVEKIFALLGAIDRGDEIKATALGAEIWLAYEPLGL